MRIKLNEDQTLLRDMVRRFADEVVRPRAKEIDESGEFPRGFFDQAGELGLAGVCVEEEYGGAGMDTISYCLVIEEISRECASSGVILSVNNSLVCDPLGLYGNEEQKREFLTPLASGEKLGCFALTEPGAGSDAGACVRRGRGSASPRPCCCWRGCSWSRSSRTSCSGPSCCGGRAPPRPRRAMRSRSDRCAACSRAARASPTSA